MSSIRRSKDTNYYFVGAIIKLLLACTNKIVNHNATINELGLMLTRNHIKAEVMCNANNIQKVGTFKFCNIEHSSAEGENR